MEMPNVSTVLIDPAKNIKYEVLAYRQLNQDEMVFAIRMNLSKLKRKPKKNSHVKIITTIGHGDRF